MLHGFCAASQAVNSRDRSAQERAAINSVKAFRVIDCLFSKVGFAEITSPTAACVLMDANAVWGPESQKSEMTSRPCGLLPGTSARQRHVTAVGLWGRNP
jgi:hypothetical protein